MKFVQRIILIVVGLLALVYAGDYAAVRFPIPKGRASYGTVVVRPYYDVGLKSGKSDLYFLDPQCRTRLKGPVLNYPKREVVNENNGN